MEKTSAETMHVHYGLTANGKVVVLPAAEYPTGSVHAYRQDCQTHSVTPYEFAVVMTELQYEHILTSVATELFQSDQEEGEAAHKPVYMAVTVSGEQPVFAHPSVDTEDEMIEFMQNYPVAVIGPIKLADVRDQWPKTMAQQDTFDETSGFVLPASVVGLVGKSS